MCPKAGLLHTLMINFSSSSFGVSAVSRTLWAFDDDWILRADDDSDAVGR